MKNDKKPLSKRQMLADAHQAGECSDCSYCYAIAEVQHRAWKQSSDYKNDPNNANNDEVEA